MSRLGLSVDGATHHQWLLLLCMAPSVRILARYVILDYTLFWTSSIHVKFGSYSCSYTVILLQSGIRYSFMLLHINVPKHDWKWRSLQLRYEKKVMVLYQCVRHPKAWCSSIFFCVLNNSIHICKTLTHLEVMLFLVFFICHRCF